jgi:predicted nucleic acid-binding Zn ribbon protein
MTVSDTRHCEVCGKALATVRPDARYCSPKCRQIASRRARSRPTRNPEDMSLMPSSEVASSQVRDPRSVTVPAGTSPPSGSVTADAHYWPRVTVEALRAAGMHEDAETWERHFRDRGEWRGA